MRRFFQIAMNIILAPIWILIAGVVLLALLVIYIPVMCSAFVAGRRWRRALRIAGRTQSPYALLRSQVSGTLILDCPSLGWNTTYCWWTPDDIQSLAPISMPTDEDRRNTFKSRDDGKLSHPFDRWVYERYLAQETGTAILLSTRRGDRLATKLHFKFPSHKIIWSWSGPCEMDLDQQNEQSEE